ncbi:MAG TPA: glycosyltransferase [Actinophytocola sp.]|uniref:glycosyltransferase n=1 Tax=Actinophytocola sp. TaxID=1872138 RepID=UPI002DB7BCEC|nr:glycosyltransferase [Actinophytocola sp.]HEU5471777.1 glycosyltransferase [Actinophytocola sp.]
MSVHFVVPYYVDPKYLFELIESVRKQTRDDWKLTIVDDQYPGTAARDYIAELDDPRIEWVQNEQNLGTTGNTTKCLTMGKLKYLTVMGADDALEPNYVEVVVNAFERHPDAIMVHPGVNLVDGDGNPTDSLADRIKRLVSRSAWRHDELDGPTAARSLMRGNWLYCPAMCYRTDVVPRAQQVGQYASIADLAWTIDMLLGGGTMAMDKTPVFRYRRHQANHSSQHAKTLARFDEEQRYYAAAARKLRETGWTRAARAARLHLTTRLHALRSALGALGGRDVKLALSLVGRALRPAR